MRPGVFAVLFIIYCLEAGAVLVGVPWTRAWEVSLGALFGWTSASWPLHPIARGVVSGFGLVLLVWGTHDLHQLLLDRRKRGA